MRIGKYQLVRKLASGGMAEVFLAKAAGPHGFEKTLVLKRILPHLAEDPAFVDMFLGEARLAAQLEHPNIVQIFDFGEAEGSFFLAMEFIDGPNLRKLVKQAAAEALPPAFCAKVVASAAEGLAYAHEFRDMETGEPLGLIHRDVSPDNILVSRQGAVKVVDFGIAKVAGQGHRTLTGVVKGKVAYMPPEQLQAKDLDRRVDVYALGVVLYELLSGRRPFDATTDVSVMQAILFEPFIPVAQRRPDVPVALQQVLDNALAKDREQRYPDCRALQDDLERFVLSTGEPVGAYQIAQRIAQWVPEVAAPAMTPSQGAGRSSVAPPSKAEVRSPPPSMESPVDSTSPTTPMPRALPAPDASASLDSTSPTTPMPMVVAGVVRGLEAQGPHERDTLQSYPVVVKSPALRPGAQPRVARGAARERLPSRASELRAAAGHRTPRMSGTERDEEAVAMAVAAAVVQEETASAAAPVGDADDAVHTRSTEYLATPKAKTPSSLAAAVVGGLVVLAVGGGVALMRGGEGEATPVRVDPPPLALAPSEPRSQPKESKVAAATVDSPADGSPSPDAVQRPALTQSVPVTKAPPDERPAGDVQPVSLNNPPAEEADVAPVAAKAALAKPPAAKAATPSRVRASTPARRATTVAKGSLEFRVRPYAVVSLDGKVLGQTPFAAVEVPEGRHTVRLVNKELGKDVTRTIDVKAGQSNVFKLNLEVE
ncbi:protein kinase domain-containing protein [Myxococcus sp. Y35]|uniref:protein kinase domain-containing protein n=1 Tax=Pseudomyxococcus flavus TaxID=3115648 RepID=UPI003CF05A53